MPTLIRFRLILVATMFGPLAAARAADLEAGVAAVDITPPLGYRMAGYYAERVNTGTHDPLFARALVFRQGNRRAALVFCDLVGIPRSTAGPCRERASAATGIPAENIAIAATHSHTGPLYFGGMHTYLHEKNVVFQGRDALEAVNYPTFLADRVAEAVSTAWKALAPVRLEAGTGNAQGLSFNRRFRMKDGTYRFNPGALNPDIVRPAGPVDPEVGIILLKPPGAPNSPPIAGLTVFAMHLDTVGGTEYSADYPFYLAMALKQAFGPGFVSIFGAGTCGDINHIDVSRRERPPARELGERLAEAVLAARPELAAVANPGLDVRTTQVTCDVQQPSAAEIADARARADELTSPKMPFLDKVKTVKVLDLLKRYPEPKVSMEVQVFRLGPELAIVTLPGEVFVQLGMAIKARSPFENTLVVELANDAPNYIPTDKAFREGSYEVVNSRLEAGSGEQLVAATVRLLRELDRGPR